VCIAVVCAWEWCASGVSVTPSQIQLYPVIGELRGEQLSWGFSIVELTRKLIVGIVVGLAAADVQLWNLITLFLIDFIYVVFKRPYRTTAHNLLEAIASGQRIVAVSLALFSFTGVVNRDTAAESVIIMSLATLIICIGTQCTLIVKLLVGAGGALLGMYNKHIVAKYGHRGQQCELVESSSGDNQLLQSTSQAVSGDEAEEQVVLVTITTRGGATEEWEASIDDVDAETYVIC